jgi:DNA-binding transcriptional LysR family regulator
MRTGASSDKWMVVMMYIHGMNISGLNLNLLPVLDALLAERSVSRAGARLGLSQPAVSNALAQLRAVLNDPLFVRRPGGMEPTERALALAGPLRAALAAIETGLEPPAPFDPKRTKARFTIVTNDFVAFVMLPRLLERIGREAPGVHLQIRAWQEHRVPPDLERGEADLMLGFYPSLPPAHRNLSLFVDTFLWVVRQGHPRVKDGKLPLSLYTKLQHVLVSHQPDARGAYDDVLSARGLSREVVLRVSHFLLVPFVLVSTDYVAALSELVARPFAKILPLQLIKPAVVPPTAQVQMVWHDRTDTSPAHAWLRGVVAEISRDLKMTCKVPLKAAGRQKRAVAL